jgi:type II secretory pathway pseudopilin PulG
MRRNDRVREAGHTLLEVVMVMILVGIMAAVAAPRFVNPKAGPAAMLVASDLQYAKELALRLQTESGVYFLGCTTDCTSYRVFVNNDINDAAVEPLGGGDLEVTMSGSFSGVTLSHDIAEGILKFDALGTPLEGSAGNSLPAVRSITITSAAENRTVTIEPNTGKVTVP